MKIQIIFKEKILIKNKLNNYCKNKIKIQVNNRLSCSKNCKILFNYYK